MTDTPQSKKAKTIAFRKEMQTQFHPKNEKQHIHVHGESGEAKFWIEPRIELVRNYGLTDIDLGRVKKLIEEHEDGIRNEWRRHFGG